MDRGPEADDARSAPEIVAWAPADVLRLATAAALLVALVLVKWLFGDSLVAFAAEFLSGLSAVPQWLVDTVLIGARVIAIVVLGAGVIVTIVRSGVRMLLTVLIAAVAAGALVLLLDELITVDEAGSVAAVDVEAGPLSESGFPSAIAIGALTAVVTAAAPWLSRRWRRWGWVAVIGLMLARFVTFEVAFDSVEAVVAGWFAGAAVLVVLGAPSRRPTAASIQHGLAVAGLPLQSLDPASVDARGSTPYFGVGTDGARYFVKALGADQRSADLLFRLYRATQRKDLGDERPFSSLRRAVEHEAFLALAARDLGVRTPRVRAVAVAEPDALVLAYDAVNGKSLDGLDPAAITDDVLADVWAAIGQLRAHRIAHRDLRLANIFLSSDGEVWMIDFGFSEIAASDLLIANDVAELVASSAAIVGPERAAAHAIAAVDRETLHAAADRLQGWALSGATRTAMKEQPGVLDDLRARLSAA